MLIQRVNRLAEIARRNRQEIIAAALSRREMFKLGLLTSAGYLVAKKGLSARVSSADDSDVCSSPPTRAFVELLPTPRDGTMPIQTPVPVSALSPAPVHTTPEPETQRVTRSGGASGKLLRRPGPVAVPLCHSRSRC